jgi:DNA-binding response OmpR family regulator
MVRETRGQVSTNCWVHEEAPFESCYRQCTAERKSFPDTAGAIMEPKLRERAALIGCSDDWMCRSLQSVFEEKGYTATGVRSGKHVLQLARRGGLDIVLLDEGIDELPAVEVCVALRDDPLFDHATPIVITSSAHATPQSRAAAYGAGAWEYCQQPLDVDALFLKLGTFLRARAELEVSQSQRLMDPASGLYTLFGLEQLSEHLGARAVRRHEAFACVAFSPQRVDREVASGHALVAKRSGFADVVNVVRVRSRKSDVVAQTGEFRLAILAPDTDAKGARLLVARLQWELDAASRKTTIPDEFRMRAGYCAVSDFAASKVDMKELVHRAESALDHVPAGGEGSRGVVSFDELPVA